ncbi:MAG: winged-helix domain-containing protein [Deltaproteobacteria bacterium]|nr:winged-helix domain-containing protein [Deltaproteobacteria bacterium]
MPLNILVADEDRTDFARIKKALEATGARVAHMEDEPLPPESGYDLLLIIGALHNERSSSLLERHAMIPQILLPETCGASGMEALQRFLDTIASLQLPRHPICYADLALDPDTGHAYRNGSRIALSATEYRILKLFVEHPDETLTRETIGKTVWGAAFDAFTNIVDVYVSRLRAKIDHAAPSPLLHTVRGKGYQLSARQTGQCPPVPASRPPQ